MKMLGIVMGLVMSAAAGVARAEEPAANFDADHCELYVDGVGTAQTHYTWSTTEWVESYVKVDPALLGAVETVGQWVRYAEDGQEKEDFLSGFLVSGTSNVWRIEHKTLTTSWDYENDRVVEHERPLRSFAYFVDVRREGQVVRLWVSGHGANFTPEASIAPYPGYMQSLGLGYVRYVTDASPVLSQKHACRGY